jgi:rhodanese-related sulfurtransferase
MDRKTIFCKLLFGLVGALFFTSFAESAVKDEPGFGKEMPSVSYMITAEDVLKKLKGKNETLIVDVRDEKDFEKARIPESMNIPLYALKTKDFLKGKAIFIVDQGYLYGRLEDESSNLKKKGFNVSVIQGGLNAWRDAGGIIEGDPVAIQEINKVSPRDVYQRHSGDLLIINISMTHDKKADTLFPGAISIPFDDNEKTFSMKLIDLLNKSGRISTLLLFNEKGERYEIVERVVQTTSAKNVFYLAGGVTAYKDFLNEQTMMGNSEKVSTSKGTGCGTCQ